MDDIKQRLDHLRNFIQEPDFIESKGLSNEVNIRIFCYDPKDEMIVKHFIEQITTDKMLACNIIERDLYEILLECCTDIDILDAIPEMEDSEGSDYILEQLRTAIGVNEFVEKIQYSPHRSGDVLMLTGVGDVFPFMRVHSLLEALQPHFTGVPVLVMYPGEFDGYRLKLFNKLKSNDYYRAFNVV